MTSHADQSLQHWTDRPVHCVLGLPIDAVTMDQALIQVRQAVATRQSLFLSTPNTNFAMAALRDPAFRHSVQCSDLSVADGMPLIWAARLMGTPIPERVAGADLFDRLLREPGPTIRVYFFGGPDGAAQEACKAVNQRGGALRCVGHCSPGFGSVADLSAPALIDAINASEADMVVVSLGAAKGQQWIMRNRAELDAPVLTHLGAVVNFVAGTVQRAPRWLGVLGLEWLWRVAMEPALWRRYAGDGIALLHLVGCGLVPERIRAAYQLLAARSARPWPQQETLGTERQERTLRLTPPAGATSRWIPQLRTALRHAEQEGCQVVLDLRHVAAADDSLLGLLQLAQVRVKGLSLERLTPTLARSMQALATGPLMQPTTAKQAG